MTDIHSDEMVLIVDDSKSIRDILKIYIKKLGAHLAEAENGQIALEMVKERKYFIYIVDLKMPVMDGKTFIEHLKKIQPDAVIMVQSGMDSPQRIIDIMRMGIFDYIIKPIDKDLFQKSFAKTVSYARLLNSQKKEKARFRNELKQLRAIQNAQMPKFDKFKEYDISFSVLPMEDFSGDFVDGYFLDKDVFQIVLCDVSGHGIVSSYIGTEIRGVFRAMSSSEVPLSDLMIRANNKIFKSISSSSYFATVVICQLNMKTGLVKFVSAGHPESLFYISEKNISEKLSKTGPLFGIYPNGKYKEISIPMNTNDSILLYTDGITEAMSEDGQDMYEIERLTNVFMDSIKKSSVEVIHEILNSLYEFTSFGAQEDDISLICIKRS